MLSPGTARGDVAEKLIEYQALPSVMTAMFIHPARHAVALFERASADEWRQLTLLSGAAIAIRHPAVMLASVQIFRGT